MKNLNKETHEAENAGLHFYSNMLMLHIFFTFEFLESIPLPLKDTSGDITRSYLESKEIALYMDSITDDQIHTEIAEYGYETEDIKLPDNAEDNRLRFLFHATMDTRAEYEEIQEMQKLFNVILRSHTKPDYPNHHSMSERLLMSLQENELVITTNNSFAYCLQDDMPFARELYEKMRLYSEKHDLENYVDDLEEKIEDMKEDHKADVKNARIEGAESQYEAETGFAFIEGYNEAIKDVYNILSAFEFGDLEEMLTEIEGMKKEH